MKIAITFRDDLALKQAWFGSGIAQNIKFYYDLFELMGHELYFLVNTSSFEVQEKGINYRTLVREEVVKQQVKLDIIIEAGVTISPPDQELLRKASGAKIIGLRCGNQYFKAVEGTLTAGDLTPNQFTGGHDAMWILPHHKDQKEWLSILHDCPVHVVPYIWEADFVDENSCKGDLAKVPNIVVMEPNISVLKNAFLPLATIQHLFRTAPDRFNKAFIYNSANFSGAEKFLYNFVDKWDVLQAHKEKVYFQKRHPFPDIFKEPHVLLGHQHHNELNNLYKDAVYLGVPLVHNSPPYAEVGYFYEGLEAKSASKQVLNAIENHNRADAIERGRSFLTNYSIHNKSIQDEYESLLAKEI